MAEKTLEERVRDLETKLKIAIAVAAIFGVSGGWGWKVLSSSEKHLAKLTEDLHETENKLATLKKDQEASAKQINETKEAAIKALKTEGDIELSDIQARAKPLVEDAITKEMTAQIGATKRWTRYVYDMSATVPPPGSGNITDWWKKALANANPQAQADLK